MVGGRTKGLASLKQRQRGMSSADLHPRSSDFNLQSEKYSRVLSVTFESLLYGTLCQCFMQSTQILFGRACLLANRRVCLLLRWSLTFPSLSVVGLTECLRTGF